MEAPNISANRGCDNDEDVEDAIVTYDSRTNATECDQ